jgi:general secretion pathway protein G
MKIKSIRWGLVLCFGWFLILATAAIILPPIDSTRFSRSALLILALTAVWLLLTVGALATYFYRAWHRVPQVSNKTMYVAWLTFETACVLASLYGLVWLFVPIYGPSPRQARERVLQQDLVEMRALISQYTLDMRKPPLSLDDLVAGGYLKAVPTDPMTGRKDTWIVICSSDRSQPGIVGIDSGSGNTGSRGKLHCDR